MHKLKRVFAIAGSVLFAIGCGTTRTIFIDTEADLVRIGPDVQGRVYVRIDGEWILGKNKVRLPEGWIAGPLPKEKENE